MSRIEHTSRKQEKPAGSRGRGMDCSITMLITARYPNVAAEILTCELWVVPETVMMHKEALLRPFIDSVLPAVEKVDESRKAQFRRSEMERARIEFWTEEDEERDRKKEVIIGLWSKVLASLLTKRTTEVRTMTAIRGLNQTTRVVPLTPQIDGPLPSSYPRYGPSTLRTPPISRNPRSHHSTRPMRRGRGIRNGPMAQRTGSYLFTHPIPLPELLSQHTRQRWRDAQDYRHHLRSYPIQPTRW